MSAHDGEAPAKPFASWWVRDLLESPHCKLSAPARAVLQYLASKVNAAYYCWPSIELIGRAVAKSDSTVHRAIRELGAAGVVKVFAGGQGPRTTNGYYLPVKGVIPDTLTPSTRVSPMTPMVIHKGVTHDSKRVSPMTPEVDSEVSRQRARVTYNGAAASVEDLLSLTNKVMRR